MKINSSKYEEECVLYMANTMNVYPPPLARFLRGLIGNLNVILWRINVFNLKCILKIKSVLQVALC